jgi:hypothetical protein
VGIAVDSDDRIYVTQHQHKQLIVFDPALNPLGPVDGLPDLSMAWGLKAVGEGEEKPLLYFDNNVTGSITLFNEMMKAGVKRVIFSS